MFFPFEVSLYKEKDLVFLWSKSTNSSFVYTKSPQLDNFQENVWSVHFSKVLTVLPYYYNIFVANQKCLFSAVECMNGYFMVTCKCLFSLSLTTHFLTKQQTAFAKLVSILILAVPRDAQGLNSSYTTPVCTYSYFHNFSWLQHVQLQCATYILSVNHIAL